ncbi:hypothetical protein HDU67_004267 [Dinochytrium kinnereticum]|nr:hypothetical protein HDU67_004267 [Dinochytrium kinnereticum]
MREKDQRVWRPSWFLQPLSPKDPAVLIPGALTKTPAALIMLNQPLGALSWLERMWMATSIHLCADGGANRLFDLCGDDETRRRFLPDRILGDLDSLRNEVKNVHIEKIEDQDSTDLGKCVSHIESIEYTQCNLPTPPSVAEAVDVPIQPGHRRPGEVPPFYEVIVMGALGGRFDQTMASVNKIYNMGGTRKVYLVCCDSLVVLLTPEFEHRIECDRSIEGPTCGLLPVGCKAAHMETEGLKWNIGKPLFPT